MRALQADGIVTLSSAVRWLGLCVVVLSECSGAVHGSNLCLMPCGEAHLVSQPI